MTNEQNLERFANMIGPAYELFTDGELKNRWNDGDKLYEVVPLAIKRHNKAVIELLAAMEGIPVDEYVVPGPLALAGKIMALLSSDEVQGLFPAQGQKTDNGVSGSATENIEGNGD